MALWRGLEWPKFGKRLENRHLTSSRHREPGRCLPVSRWAPVLPVGSGVPILTVCGVRPARKGHTAASLWFMPPSTKEEELSPRSSSGLPIGSWSVFCGLGRAGIISWLSLDGAFHGWFAEMKLCHQLLQSDFSAVPSWAWNSPAYKFFSGSTLPPVRWLRSRLLGLLFKAIYDLTTQASFVDRLPNQKAPCWAECSAVAVWPSFFFYIIPYISLLDGGFFVFVFFSWGLIIYVSTTEINCWEPFDLKIIHHDIANKEF